LIETFGDRKTERLFQDEHVREFAGIAERAKRKLEMLNAAERLNDLVVPPSNRLEKLRGKLQHMHSIRINDQWRIIFEWSGTGARNVTVVDYH
jgi:proteic killer suppression protein